MMIGVIFRENVRYLFCTGIFVHSRVNLGKIVEKMNYFGGESKQEPHNSKIFQVLKSQRLVRTFLQSIH